MAIPGGQSYWPVLVLTERAHFRIQIRLALEADTDQLRHRDMAVFHAHAVGEADEAGVGVYYLGLGPVRVDPLPEVFGSRRSRRIRHVEELPRVLAHVHRELVSA